MKKIISILLIFSMLICMTFGASAANITKGISKINEQQFQDALELNAKSGMVLLGDTPVDSISDLSNFEASPGQEIKIYLTPNMFLKSDGTPLGDYKSDTLSLNALRTGKITVRATSSNSNVAQISLKSDKTRAYISVKFDSTPTISSKRFNYSIYLYANSVRKTTTKITVKGILTAPAYEVDSYDDYADLSDGKMLTALTNVRNIELYLGDHVTMVSNLTRGKKYAGTASADILPQDEPLFIKYNSLDSVIRMRTINLKGTGSVYFDLDRIYYVYNTNGLYIGTSNKPLPYWTRYYLTTKKLDSIKVTG